MSGERNNLVIRILTIALAAILLSSMSGALPGNAEAANNIPVPGEYPSVEVAGISVPDRVVYRAETLFAMRNGTTPAVAASYFHTVGLKPDGTVLAVGYNDYGQLNVQGWTGMVQVSAGYSHTVGLKSDGTVLAVGRTDFSQCNVAFWTGMVQRWPQAPSTPWVSSRMAPWSPWEITTTASATCSPGTCPVLTDRPAHPVMSHRQTGPVG